MSEKHSSPDQLLTGNGSVDVQLLRDKAPKLNEISAAATKLEAQAKEISEPAYLSAMRDARPHFKRKRQTSQDYSETQRWPGNSHPR